MKWDNYIDNLVERLQVWNKGAIVPGYDTNAWRRDDWFKLISFDAYGDRSSQYGWEIDHIVAISIGGADVLENKRPLHWRKNASLGGYLSAAKKNSLGATSTSDAINTENCWARTEVTSGKSSALQPPQTVSNLWAQFR